MTKRRRRRLPRPPLLPSPAAPSSTMRKTTAMCVSPPCPAPAPLLPRHAHTNISHADRNHRSWSRGMPPRTRRSSARRQRRPPRPRPRLKQRPRQTRRASHSASKSTGRLPAAAEKRRATTSLKKRTRPSDAHACGSRSSMARVPKPRSSLATSTSTPSAPRP